MEESAVSFSELVPQDSAAIDRRASAANAELEYLLQLRHHLNAAFELFDERCMPILPPGNGTIIKRLRRLAVQPDGSPMRSALEQVLATGQSRAMLRRTPCERRSSRWPSRPTIPNACRVAAASS